MNRPALAARAAALRELERHAAVAWLSMGSFATPANRAALARVTVLRPVNSRAGGNPFTIPTGDTTLVSTRRGHPSGVCFTEG